MEDSERRKVAELIKEMRNNSDDVKTNTQEGGLKWMYKGPTDLIDREEYLLGKAIDKTFEELNSGGNSELVGRTGEQSNIPKRLLEKTDNTEQVDIAKKILEDPLYAIKQKEMEARKKLLNNPVKLKQIKQMLLERSKQSNTYKKEKKEKRRKRIEEQLNLRIIKKLKKFSDKEKRKALNKIMKSESVSSSSSSEDNKKKHKSQRKRSHSSSSSSSNSSSSSGDDSSSESSSSEDSVKNEKHKKRKRKETQKKKRTKSSSDSESSNSSGSSENENEKKRKKHKKNRKSNNSVKNVSDNDSRKKKRKEEEKKDSHNRRRDRERDDREKRKFNRRDDSDDKKQKKGYGLMLPYGRNPEVKRRSPVRKYEKKVETKPKYVPPQQSKPVSEKERQEKLKEMMADAKQRKEERERNLANHRKKESQEEQSKEYDEDFMRRQMKHLTSQGTMADRIKSNINNIQRSKSSMDSNFMRK